MSIGEDRIQLGQERRLIFENFANGIEIEALAEPYRRSPDEVRKDIGLVARKIAEYRHRRCLQPAGIRKDPLTGRNVGGNVPAEQGLLPPIPCGTEEEIRLNSNALLWALQFLTDENLSTEHLHIPTLTTHRVENMAHVLEAARYVHVGTARLQ